MTAVYRKIASTLLAIRNCENGKNWDWKRKHEETLKKIMESAPSGSGFDSGIQLLDESTPDKLVFQLDYHHMNENGYYVGWSYNTATITANLCHGFDIDLSCDFSGVDDPDRDTDDDDYYFRETLDLWLEENYINV